MIGVHKCIEIRQISKVPIIFLSSATDNMNMIMAMNMAAVFSILYIISYLFTSKAYYKIVK